MFDPGRPGVIHVNVPKNLGGAAVSQPMTSRFELFVDDPDRSAGFYTAVLGFELAGASESYRSLRRGGVRIGIGDAGHLGEGHHFMPEIVSGRRGLGVEIVLEVDDVETLHAHVQRSGYHIHEALTSRPWGLSDFRLVDPDGYYLRITSRR